MFTLTTQNSIVNEFCKIQLSKFAVNLGLDIDTPLKLRLFSPKNVPEDVRLRRGLAFREEAKGKVVNNAKHGVIYPITRHPKLPFDVKIQKQGKDGVGLISDHRGFEEHYNKGYNAYVVINDIPADRIDKSTGSDDDVIACRALFFECDDISIEAQWEKLRDLEQLLGRKATMVVQTYKSLHCYFTLEASCSKEEWTYFQQRLIQRMGSDDSLWNPSRIMRLPGLPYRKFEGGDITDVQLVVIAEESGNRFTLAEFNGILPEWDRATWEKAHKKHNKQASRSSLKGQINVPMPENMPPYDMRLLAPYLPDYVEGGRRGWDTARCPVHALEGDHSGDSLHVNRATGAYVCHAGCSRQEIWKATHVIALTAGYSPKKPQKWQSLPFEPDFVCHSRHFLTDLQRPTQPLVAIGGAVGLGKSFMVQGWLKAVKRAKVEAILPRITLERDSATKYGLNAKNEMDVWKPYESDCCYCINSVARAMATPDILVIDEVVQVLYDAFTSDIMKRKRSEILYALKCKIIDTIATGGQVIVMDAHLSTPILHFFMELLGLKREDVYLINNTHAGQVREYRITKNLYDKELMLLRMQEEAQAGKRIFVASDSCECVQEQYEKLIQLGVPQESIRLITAKTVATDEEVQALVSTPDTYFEANLDVRIVLASPALQSGVSITKGDFERGYGFYFGTYNPRLMIQQMARYRPPLDWDVWITPHAHTNKFRHTDPQQLLDEWHSKTEDAVKLLDLQQAIVRGKKIMDMVDMFQTDPFLRCCAELLCQDNFEKLTLLDAFKALLEHSGQKAVDKQWWSGIKDAPDHKEAKESRKERKQLRAKHKEREIDAILAIPLPKPAVLDEIQARQNNRERLSQTEYQQLRRAEIEQYVEQVPPEKRQEARESAAKAILQDDGKAKLRRLFQLLQDTQKNLSKGQSQLLYALEKDLAWIPDYDFSVNHVDFYKKSGIYDLIHKVFAKNPINHASAEVQKVAQSILGNKTEAAKFLPRDIAFSKTKDKTGYIKLIKKVLLWFGVPLTEDRLNSLDRAYILDEAQMWQPWKVTLFKQIRASAVTQPPAIKKAIGTYVITSQYTPWVGGPVHRQSTSTGQTFEFFFDGTNYFAWADDQYMMLAPSNFNQCCEPQNVS
jgi:hypothetical protein